MANNYLVCRDNLIQDLELILRDQLLVVAGGCVVFCSMEDLSKSTLLLTVEGGIVIFCGCNRPSFQPLRVVLRLTLLPSLLEHNLLHCIYCDNVSRGGRREGGPRPPDSLHLLFWYAYYSEAGAGWMLERERAVIFIKISDACFLRHQSLIMDNISTARLEPQVFCFKVLMTRLWLTPVVRQRALATY